MEKKWKVFFMLHIWNIPNISYKVNNLLYFFILKFKIAIAFN